MVFCELHFRVKTNFVHESHSMFELYTYDQVAKELVELYQITSFRNHFDLTIRQFIFPLHGTLHY